MGVNTFLGLGRRSIPSGGFSRGGQTPHRFHSRNHGLCAYVSSCLRFAAERSLKWSGRVSGRAKMCSSHSISAIACSASILPQYLPEVRRRRKAALARSLKPVPTVRGRRLHSLPKRPARAGYWTQIDSSCNVSCWRDWKTSVRYSVPKQPRKCYLIDSLSLALRHRPRFYAVFGT